MASFRTGQAGGLFDLLHFLMRDRTLQPEGLHRPRGVAGSRFRALPRFSTAAPRRSLGSVSVPVWPDTLSGRLPIIALVSRYLTNKLIGLKPLSRWKAPEGVPTFRHHNMCHGGGIRY